jgi:hypothetical protein
VANTNRGRRGRTRKRRPAAASAAQTSDAPPASGGSQQEAKRESKHTRKAGRAASRAPGEQSGRSQRRAAGKRSGRGLTGTLALGERPQAPWHPLPLSELLILVGAIGTAIGLSRGESGKVLIFAGLAAVLIGTIEVTLREHLSGYRSHTLILSVLPAIVLYTALELVTRPALVVNLVLLALAVLLATLLFKLLRARFLDARRERSFSVR